MREPNRLSKGSETHARIVDRAMTLVSQLGLDGLTIGALATDLGLSKSGLFAHFQSKERLQLEVLNAAAEDFRRRVFLPALTKPRGEPRLRAIFENWLDWVSSDELPGGCIFLAGAAEWDDRPGPVRDHLVKWFMALECGLVKACQLAIEEGHFRADLDSGQLAYELHALVMKYHLEERLIKSASSRKRAEGALCRLLESARSSPPAD